jgi:hypothetical protein
VRYDSLANGKRRNSRPDFFNRAAEFVPHNERRHAARTPRFECLKLAAADAARLYPEQYLARARLRFGSVSYRQFLVFGIK